MEETEETEERKWRKMEEDGGGKENRDMTAGPLTR
jgi:hypothetical protein